MGRDSTSTFLVQRSLRCRSVGCEGPKSKLNLFQNRREVFRVWAHTPGVIPLKVRLYAAVDPPICVPQMIIQNRVGRLQVNCLLQRLSRFIVLPKLKVSPPETIDYITVIRS